MNKESLRMQATTTFHWWILCNGSSTHNQLFFVGDERDWWSYVGGAFLGGSRGLGFNSMFVEDDGKEGVNGSGV